jgi:nuclear mRNA export protein PCID2/THP1
MADMHSFISSINQYISQEDGISLAKSVRLPVGRKSIPKVYQQLAQRAKSINAVSYCESNILDTSIATSVGNMILALVAMCDSKWNDVYNYELLAYNALLAYFRDAEGSSWTIPMLSVLSNDLRLVAQQADSVLMKRDNETLRDALRNLTNGFNAVAKDRKPYSDPSSKKLAIFSVTNVLFKIYFKLNTLQLCSKLINVVERPGASNALDSFRLFPVSDVVTYKYYIGRLKMFEDKYEDARYAFIFLSINVQLIEAW